MRKFANVFCWLVPPLVPVAAAVFCAFLPPPQAAARRTTPVASTAMLTNQVHRSFRVTSSTSRSQRRPGGLRVLRYPSDSYRDDIPAAQLEPPTNEALSRRAALCGAILRPRS